MIDTLTARRLITPEGTIDYPVLTLDGDRIASIEAGEPSAASETLTPGFLDIHVHGAVSYDFMHAGATEIRSVGRFLAKHGVSHYLPTTVTGPLDSTLRALETLADAIEEDHAGADHATPVGIHLEGPFVSHGKRGVHPEASILEPSITCFDRFQQAARGHIRLMTMAPELPGALELVEHATGRGVRVSLGHSNGTAAETLEAIAAGAISGTHGFNAMRPLGHREPGIVGTLLDRDDVFLEAICDGVHVDPAIIRLWLKMKGERRGILVTDGMSATGMPDGVYSLGDFPVEVQGSTCLSNGTLAGSVLTMDQAVANLQSFTGSSLRTAVLLASRNPAEMLGLSELTDLKPGSLANLNVFDEAGLMTGAILNGRRV